MCTAGAGVTARRPPNPPLHSQTSGPAGITGASLRPGLLGAPVLTPPWALSLDGPREGAQSFRKPRAGCPGGKGPGLGGEQGLQGRGGCSGRTCQKTPGSGPRAEGWPCSAPAFTKALQRPHGYQSERQIPPPRADGSD